MRCPACRTEQLITLELDEVEVDYCDDCHGIWLDAGELELLFGDAEACARFLSIGSPAQPAKGEPRRKCPECGRRMNKECTRGRPPVTFDHCPANHGMWLDKGELETILRHAESITGGAGAEPEEVVRFLRDVFPARIAAAKASE